MNKQIIIALIVGLIIGGIGAFAIVSTNSTGLNNHENTSPNSNMMGNNTGSEVHNVGSGSMADMNNALKNKTGDEFDKAFISNMIEHHQGAIDMANQAKVSAKHEELKKMADDIISAQTSEIEMMKQWQKDWGYTQ